jgi:hypothetical protein
MISQTRAYYLQARKRDVGTVTAIRRNGHVALHRLPKPLREHHRAVPVRLEVNADIKLLRFVVQVFDTGLGHVNGHAERAHEPRGGAVCVGGLHHGAGEV